jgi:hypothetical protein
MRWDWQGTVLWTCTIPMFGWITVPTPLWHWDINIGENSVWVGILDDWSFRQVVSPNRLIDAVYRRVLVNDLPELLEHVPLHQQQHVVHVWWGTTSFSAHCQTAPEPNFQWTVDRMQRPSQLACTISWPQSSAFLAVGTPKDIGVFSTSQWLISIRAMNRENACYKIQLKPGIYDRVHTSVWWRAEGHVEVRGNHIAHLLWRAHELHPCLSRNLFLNVSCKWVLYTLKACNRFFNTSVCVCACVRASVRPQAASQSWTEVLGGGPKDFVSKTIAEYVTCLTTIRKFEKWNRKSRFMSIAYHRF